MNIYFWLVVFIILMAIIFRGEEKKKWFLITAYFALFFVMGFRHSAVVGVDSAGAYFESFKAMKYTNPVFEMNFALFYLMKLIYDITGGNYHLFIILVSGFVIYSYYYLAKHYSTNTLVTIFWFLGMGYYTLLFSALKQAMAMAILCYAFDAIMKKKPIRFVIIVAVAACFHYPALVFLPAYWIAKMNISRYYFIVLAALLVITFVFRSQILSWMAQSYKGDESTYANQSVQFFGTKVILMILIVVAAYVLRTPGKEDRLYTVLLLFMGIAIVFQTFCYYNNIFERLADYYYVFSIFCIPMIFENIGEYPTMVSAKTLSTVNIAGTVVVSVFSIWRFLSAVVAPAAHLLPYIFCWQPLTDYYI